MWEKSKFLNVSQHLELNITVQDQKRVHTHKHPYPLTWEKFKSNFQIRKNYFYLMEVGRAK